MPLAPGTQLGPYEIGAPLGAGGMGEVYRARDTRLERSVAIKILPAQFSSDPVRKQRFEREAKTISSLNHPHICTLHDVGSQDGVDYLVMECVEGDQCGHADGSGDAILSHDRTGRPRRNISVHVTGTDRGERAGRPQRYFFSRRRAVRNADWPARVPGKSQLSVASAILEKE